MTDYTDQEIEKLRRTISVIAIWHANHSAYPQDAVEQLELALHRVDQNQLFTAAIACIKPITQTASAFAYKE